LSRRYVQKTIGLADDHLPANGKSVTFFQAQSKIIQWAAKARAPVVAKGPLTVEGAMTAYFDRLEQEGSKSLADARGRCALHIIPVLGAMLVDELTKDVIAGWLASLAAAPKGVKLDQDATRARRASANRVLNILKAGLNQAFRDGKVASDTAWRSCRPFRGVDAARLRYLPGMKFAGWSMHRKDASGI
jgi:hypothetical protein